MKFHICFGKNYIAELILVLKISTIYSFILSSVFGAQAPWHKSNGAMSL
jgi:hypothetical protein